MGQEVGSLVGPAPCPFLWGERVDREVERSSYKDGQGLGEISPSGVALRLRATLRALLPQPAPLSGEGEISLAIYIT